MRENFASFRDDSGRVYEDGNRILRTITRSYAENWGHVKESGLLEKAIGNGMIPAREIPVPPELAGDCIHTVLEVQRVPFISYAHEWSFTQLRDAALLTLKMQKLALEHGCILKDASAYNVQFLNGKPVFIDVLSFEIWDQQRPWEAYKQFCSHFLAPLALEAYVDRRCGALSANWIDGIPLDLACAMLPARARLSLGLNLHLFLHSSMRTRHGDARESAEKARKVTINPQKMLALMESLENTVLKLRPVGKSTEWGDYYEDTNYSEKAMRNKEMLVSRSVKRHAQSGGGRGAALDLGANDGHFSRLLEPDFEVVIAADIDPAAVDANYKNIRERGSSRMLPLILDLTCPSPGIGWANQERPSFERRARADFILALALCHHLHFTGGIPFEKIAEFFASLLNKKGSLLVEFVPGEDSQVKRLLAARDVSLENYTLENFQKAFENAGFGEIARNGVEESDRTLLEYKLND